MPKATQKFTCDICGSEYATEGLAKQCENLGYDETTSTIKEGDEVEFTREQRGEGSHLTFFRDKGKVIHKFVAYNQKANKHLDVLMLACKDDEGKEIERSAFIVVVEGDEKPQLFSAPSEQFSVGFTQALKEFKANG